MIRPLVGGRANATTAFGALCFLVGGVLLLPESAERETVSA